MAQHQTPAYDNWTAFITLDWDWHWEHSAPAQCPACTQEANEAPLEERRLKLSMHYYVKTRACIDNPAHHGLHEFDRTTRDLYDPRLNGRGGMTRPSAPPHWSQSRGSHDLCRYQCRIGLPPEDIQPSTRNVLWSLSDKGTHVRFCWVPSHCGIDGNEIVDQLAKETLDKDIDPLASVHYTDMKPLVNPYIQNLVQTNWDVAVHGRDIYLVKPTLGPPKKFQHLTRAEEVVITRLRIGHTKATKSHILSRGPATGCHHCGQTLTIDHMLLECALLQECRDEYYTVDSLNALFETSPETCIVENLREAGFSYLIWCKLLTSSSPETCTIWSDLSHYLKNESNSETHLLA